jgi:mono/diheme cytochrome c family protein/glucose/arabinose dehydrogenase
MSLLRLPVSIVLASLVMATAFGAQTQEWPLGAIRQLAEDGPAVSPEEEMKTFVLPPGYRVELVASEPMVVDPVLIDWDLSGRMWVIEMSGYMSDITASDEMDPTGRIVVLEDVDGDGRMDKRTVFAEDLVLPRSLKVLDKGVLIAEPPHLWLMKDTNGDLRADTRESVTERYGRRESNVEHNANGLFWALDNWMYTSESDIYLRLKHGTFETVPTLSRGQWGLSQDDAGRVYRNTNSAALFVDLIPARYFQRHPGLIRTRGLYESLGGPELNETWPIIPTPGVNRGYQTGILREDQTLAAFTAAAAPTVYRGDRLPAELYGNVFIAEPTGNLVSRIIIEDDGRTLRGRKAYQRAEFLASSSERFRPVNLSSAPDGTLYIIDMYRGIIQHKFYVTEYLRDQILRRQLDSHIHRGRIWRVVHESTRRAEPPALQRASTTELVETLAHPNGWWRDTAQRLLVERADAAAVAPLTTAAEGAPDSRTRLHALWALDGIDAVRPATVLKALADPSRDVRVAALRVSERWLPSDAALQAAVVARVEDADWWVRQQSAATFGFLPRPAREKAIATLLERYAGDPVVLDAAMSSLRDAELELLRHLMADVQTPEREAAVTMIAATVVRTGRSADVQELFGWIADAQRTPWQRSALLRGAEVALVGAAAPGTPARRGGGGGRGAEPCPTCPGGRAGPGGAPAFPTAPPQNAGGAPAGRGRGNTGPALMLTEEPVGLVALARESTPLGQRAAAVLARIGWPGRPGMRAPMTPLTPEEQQQFAAGEQIYKNVCIVCHQADGRGVEKAGPPLVESPLALAAPTIPARIVLNGKEGPVGLMPPLGATMSDADVAAVLTFVRRSWGHAASAVTPAHVAQTRAAVGGRSRPWTAQELQSIDTLGR